MCGYEAFKFPVTQLVVTEFSQSVHKAGVYHEPRSAAGISGVCIFLLFTFEKLQDQGLNPSN